MIEYDGVSIICIYDDDNDKIIVPAPLSAERKSRASSSMIALWQPSLTLTTSNKQSTALARSSKDNIFVGSVGSR